MTTDRTAQQAAMDDAADLIKNLELSYLVALQRILAEHIEARREDGIADAREQIRKLAAAVGISMEELVMLDQPKPKPPVKYRHPQTGETWTGMGRQPPQWVRDWLAAGKHLTDLDVSRES